METNIVNKWLLDYFVIELKKMEEIKEAEIVLKNKNKKYNQGPHES